MSRWLTRQIEVKAYEITAVSPLMDDCGRDITIKMDDGKESIRHAGYKVLGTYEPKEGDYWVELDGMAKPMEKKLFEGFHKRMED